MDWKTFIANVVGSLAWPAVVIALLFLLRRHLGGMAERLKELSLPGGAKATFEKQLDIARNEAESLPPSDSSQDRLVPLTDEKKYLELAEAFPEAAVIQSYKEIEELTSKLAPLLGTTVNPPVVIDALVKRELIDSNTRDLFQTLRKARNAAAHTGGDRRITPGEAIDYRSHADRLTGRLSYALGYLQQEEKNKKPRQ